MMSSCTVCGHTPDPAIKFGDPAVQPLEYIAYEGGRRVTRKEHLCARCFTLVNISVMDQINDIKIKSMGVVA